MEQRILRNKVFVVSGGSGFIGSHFVEKLAREHSPSKIFVIDSFTYASDIKNLDETKRILGGKLEIIRCDVNDSKKYINALKNSDFVIHFAAESHVDNSLHSPKQFVSSNISGTFEILEATRLNSSALFLMISTDEVYGSLDQSQSADERYNLNPSSIYSASKAAAELLCIANSRTHRQKILIARSCNNYGPRQFPEKLIPLFIKKIQMGEKVPVYGDGKNVREWIHVEDNVEGINLLLSSGNIGEIYNVGSGENYTNIEIACKILEYMGAGKDRITYVDDRKGHDFRYSLDSNKASIQFNWKPKIPFGEGIKSTIDWYLKDA
jgi:dTDP-glucose 4,6-dehydratase